MRPLVALAVTMFAGIVACDDSPTEPPPVVLDPATFHLATQPVVSGLSSAVYVSAPPGDSRLFIVEQGGRIRIFKDGALLPTPFLDVSGKLTTGGERGLLSMAFDPEFAVNGRFYVYYTGALGDLFVDRHTVSANPDVANTAATPVIAIQHRAASNHNGGLLMFGPDGMLYIGTGDGGGGGDPSDNAQNINVLLGKLLRLDVRSLPYSIPASNPFVGREGADEIWAYGLRNPWRYAFDGERLFIADVGQNLHEEVNVVDAALAGVNYGWRLREGMHCYNPSTGCESATLTDPLLEYGRDDGCSITGGFVYRGSAIPELRGHYLYSDFCSGWLRSFVFDGTASNQIDWAIANVGNVTSFGVDGAGEVYLVTPGAVHRIIQVE
jgi:glucose/arabinose dehydrogenase